MGGNGVGGATRGLGRLTKRRLRIGGVSLGDIGKWSGDLGDHVAGRLTVGFGEVG